MMDISLALAIFIGGAVAGALITYAWLSDRLSIADYEPTEDGRHPL